MRFAVLSNDPRSPGDYSWIGGVSGGGKDELIDIFSRVFCGIIAVL